MSAADAFEADLDALGFRFMQERQSTGVRQYMHAASRYLTYWVHWDPGDETVLFTWEFAIGEFMSDLGMQVGSNEELNSFLYPKHDARGAQETAFVVQEMDRTEALLRAINFVDGV